MNEQPPESPLLRALDPDPAIAEAKLSRLLSHLTHWLRWRHVCDPDDGAAETFCGAFKQLTRLEGMTESDLRAFLFGIAANIAHEHRRRAARETEIDGDALLRLRSLIAAEDAALARLTLGEIQALVEPHEWQVLLSYSTDDDHAALRRELGITQGALRGMIFRIRLKIRTQRGSGQG